MIYLMLLPKAEDNCIKPYQCQVNSTCLELTYYIETLGALTIINFYHTRPRKTWVWVLFAHRNKDTI